MSNFERDGVGGRYVFSNFSDQTIFPRTASANSQNKGFAYGNNTSYGKHGALSPVFASLIQADKSLSSKASPIST